MHSWGFALRKGVFLGSAVDFFEESHFRGAHSSTGMGVKIVRLAAFGLRYGCAFRPHALTAAR